jgi:tetratricopeptide (TPR) repeat protein
MEHNRLVYFLLEFSDFFLSYASSIFLEKCKHNTNETKCHSAKALRTRGKAYKELEDYEKARKDLSAAQTIDYDDSAAEALKFVAEKMKEIEAEIVKKKVEVSTRRLCVCVCVCLRDF